MGNTMSYNFQGEVIAHGSWVVQYPWVMDCTIVMLAMIHGLYNTHTGHDPWVIQCPLLP